MIPSSEVKLNRIKAQNKEYMKILTEVTDPENLYRAVPRLEEVQVARDNQRARLQEMRELGKYNGKHLHHVANIDVSVWHAVLEVFARYDEETGELMDDGLLYKYNQEKGCVELNKDFFFALLDGPLKNFDYRGKLGKIRV